MSARCVSCSCTFASVQLLLEAMHMLLVENLSCAGAAAPALGLPQLGFLGAPAPVGPGAHAPGGWVWGVASSDALPARAPAAAPTPVDRRCLAGVGAVGAAGSVAAGPVSNSCAALPAGQVMSAGDASVAAGQPAAEPAATVAAGPPRHAHA